MHDVIITEEILVVPLINLEAVIKDGKRAEEN